MRPTWLGTKLRNVLLRKLVYVGIACTPRTAGMFMVTGKYESLLSHNLHAFEILYESLHSVEIGECGIRNTISMLEATLV